MNLKKKIILGFFALCAILLLIFLGKIVENVAADEIVINQVPITGTLQFWTTPGWHFQKFGETTNFDKAFQIWFSSKKDQGGTNDESIGIVFNDAGKGWISGSARLVMPKDAKHLEMIKAEFGTMDNLIHELIKPTITKVIFSSGPLMSSFESYAVKKNDLIRYFEDQLKFGIYKTVSKEVKRIDELSGKEKTVTVAELVEGSEYPGNYARQEEAPLAKYGIDVRAIAVESISYEEKILDQIASQQRALMDVQTAIAEAKKAKQDAIKAEEKGKADYQTAKWEQEKLNAKEIAEAEKQKTVAKLNMERAEYQKKADILKGQGEAEYKRLVIQADGALTQKLEAWVKAQGLWAEAFSKRNVPSTYITSGGDKGSTDDEFTTFMKMLNVKTAKDLSLDMRVKD